MCGDGTNDAPALAQADVGVAMNTGTAAAKEAGNMIDLDSDPTKLIEIVAIGKQLLMTRGALTTFPLPMMWPNILPSCPPYFLLFIRGSKHWISCASRALKALFYQRSFLMQSLFQPLCLWQFAVFLTVLNLQIESLPAIYFIMV